MIVKDQLERELEFDSTPQRIVSLVPSQTELLVDLGVGDRLVGVTKFCVHPKGLREKTTVVGGTKKVHLERIYALNPDLIICNKEENTAKMVEELEDIAPVWISDIKDIPDSIEMIRSLGGLIDLKESAMKLMDGICEEWRQFEQFMFNRPRRKVAYLIWKHPFMAAGTNTFIDALLRLNKFDNIIHEARYPEIRSENLLEAELVLLSTEPYPFKEEDVTEIRRRLNKDIKLVDGEYFSWYGSRLLKAFSYFRSLHQS